MYRRTFSEADMFLWVQAHFVLDEMLVNGCIFETNKANVLQPVQLLDRSG